MPPCPEGAQKQRAPSSKKLPWPANSSSSLPTGAPEHSRDCLIVGRWEIICLHCLVVQKSKEVRKRKVGGKREEGKEGGGGGREGREQEVQGQGHVKDMGHKGPGTQWTEQV